MFGVHVGIAVDSRPAERTEDEVELVYSELLQHLKALSHLSAAVKRQLASVV